MYAFDSDPATVTAADCTEVVSYGRCFANVLAGIQVSIIGREAAATQTQTDTNGHNQTDTDTNRQTDTDAHRRPQHKLDLASFFLVCLMTGRL